MISVLFSQDLWKYGRTEDGPKIVAAKRAALKGRETILRNQIVTVSRIKNNIKLNVILFEDPKMDYYHITCTCTSSCL